MTRAARSILGALVAGVVCYALAIALAAGRGCSLSLADQPLPGVVVQVHPAIRAWDAGCDR